MEGLQLVLRQQCDEAQQQVVVSLQERDAAITALHKSNTARMAMSEDHKALDDELKALQHAQAAAAECEDAVDRVRLQKELGNERELVKRLKDRIQALVTEKKAIRADLQKLELEADAKHSVSRNELDKVKEKSKEFVRKVLESKKAGDDRVTQLEELLQVSEGMAEQLQHDNMQLRLKKRGVDMGVTGGEGGGSLEEQLDATRRALEHAQEQLSRYKTRTALILRQRRPVRPGDSTAPTDEHVADAAGALDPEDAAVDVLAGEAAAVTSAEAVSVEASGRQRESARASAELEVALVERGVLKTEVVRLKDVVGRGEARQALLDADVAELSRQVEALRGAKQQTEERVRKTIQDELHHMQEQQAVLHTQLVQANTRDAVQRAQLERQARELVAGNAHVDQLLSQAMQARSHAALVITPTPTSLISGSPTANVPTTPMTTPGAPTGGGSLTASVNPEDASAFVDMLLAVPGGGRGIALQTQVGVVEAAAAAKMPQLIEGWMVSSSLWDTPLAKDENHRAPKRDLNPVGVWQESSAWQGDAEAHKLQGILDFRSGQTPGGGSGGGGAGGGDVNRESIMSREQVLDQIERAKGEVEARMSEESRGLAKHLDSVRVQLQEAETDRSRLSKQAVLLKEQLRESQALISRSQLTHNVEYIKNITVKYLESKDPTLLRALSIALQISPDEMARVERGQAKGLLGSLFG